MNVLQVNDLRVSIGGRELVRGVSFQAARGELVAVVGESGAGKSLTAKAVLGLLPPGARVSGSVRLGGQELAGASEHAYRPLRGRRLAHVPQDALSVLSPVHTVGDQLARVIRSVRGVSRTAARAQAVAALERVGIPEAARRARSYPHEFSGGMRQRVVIAMATVGDPALIIADEPTTALDPGIQEEILALLDGLREEYGTAVMLITHDLPTAEARADRVIVMQDGREIGSRPAVPVPSPLAAPNRSGPPLLEVTDLTLRYPARGRATAPVIAVDGASFTVHAGETLALVGRSGSGKSSTAAAVLMLRRPDSGSVRFDGHELTQLDEERLRAIRPAMQPVFQDPYGSLSPRLRVFDAIAEPLRVQGRWTPSTGPARVAELLDLVRLDASLGRRRPHELSGGQCQRVGIARALASDPRLLVLDEPASALDPVIRNEIVALLGDLQRELGLAQLLICHDLDLVRQVAHRVAVMQSGRIVECGPTERVLTTSE